VHAQVAERAREAREPPPWLAAAVKNRLSTQPISAAGRPSAPALSPASPITRPSCSTARMIRSLRRRVAVAQPLGRAGAAREVSGSVGM
jgi:hypothetical protein